MVRVLSCFPNMDLVKFGDDTTEFQLLPLLKILEENPMRFQELVEKWRLLAFNLMLTSKEVNGLEKKLNGGEIGIDELFDQIFCIWKREHEGDANLRVLYRALTFAGFDDLATSVKINFYDGTSSSQESTCSSETPVPPRKRRKMEKPEGKDASQDTTTTLASTIVKVEAPSSSPTPAKKPLDLIQAIRQGQSLSVIQDGFSSEVNVNMTSSEKGNTLAHEVIDSLIKNKLKPSEALEIIKWLIRKGFTEVDVRNKDGFTPLHLSMKSKDVTVELLDFFHEKGASFATVDPDGNSVLLAACEMQKTEVIQKIIFSGGSIHHKNDAEETALHIFAYFGNHAAMQVFIGQMDVNAVDKKGYSPLHWLFIDRKREYDRCLELLLSNGADVEKKSPNGYCPILEWILENDGNPFPSLMKYNSMLQINQEIASTILTAIVKNVCVIKNLLPPSSVENRNHVVDFIKYLVDDKGAKLLFKDENSDLDWDTSEAIMKFEKLKKIKLEPGFILEVNGRMKKEMGNWMGTQTKCKNLANFIESYHREIPKVVVFVSMLLAYKRKIDLIELCDVIAVGLDFD